MTLLKIRKPARRLATLPVFVLFLTVPLYLISARKEPDSAKALRVLFIGNSLTYSNDLPSVVEAFAKATGQRVFACKTIALPDFSLEDHWNKKDARKAIMKG